MSDIESELDRLLQVGNSGAAIPASRKARKHPAGWVPGVELGAKGGFIVTDPLAAKPDDWDELLRQLLPAGFAVEDYEVEGDSVEVRAWDANVGGGDTERLYYFKARIRKKVGFASGIDLEEIISAARSADIGKPKKVKGVERAYWTLITDFQAGQADGDGVEGLVSRVKSLAGLARQDLDALDKQGSPVTQIFLPITGDLVEGISGWYAMQTFSVELDRRDQVKLVRRLLTEYLLDIASIGLPVHVAVVPGNHGENREGGKAYTTLSDNDDVAIVEQIAEAFQIADIKNVTFSFPARDELSLTVEVLGWVVGLTHGHLAKFGSGVEGRILNWFCKQAAAKEPVGDAHLLFSGHYHHGRFQQLIGDTWWIQGGALCDKSAWFAQAAGLVSDPMVMKGTITRESVVEYLLPVSWKRSSRPSEEI